MVRLSALVFSAFLFSAAAVQAAPPAPSTGLATSAPYAATTAGQFAASCKQDQGGCTDIIGNVLMDKINIRRQRISACRA